MSAGLYTELLYYIKNLAETDDFVHTVVMTASDKDLEKNNIYPLLDIEVNDCSFSNGSTVLFDVVLTCSDIRDINKEIITDKFWQQDNQVDNHNTTLNILNRLWTSMYRDFTNNNITASENPTLEKITHQGVNLLDGWSLTFTAELPNTTLNLCQ